MNNKELTKAMAEAMKDYFGTPNKPVTFMRAETDMLVRMITTYFSMLSATATRLEKNKKNNFMDNVELQQSCTDLALLTNIAGKLRESEE